MIFTVSLLSSLRFHLGSELENETQKHKMFNDYTVRQKNLRNFVFVIFLFFFVPTKTKILYIAPPLEQC